MRYIMVRESTAPSFEAAVERLMRNGYLLHGSPVITFDQYGRITQYCQAMTTQGT